MEQSADQVLQAHDLFFHFQHAPQVWGLRVGQKAEDALPIKQATEKAEAPRFSGSTPQPARRSAESTQA